jgi:DNA-binding IclR family transcriptional regulator
MTARSDAGARRHIQSINVGFRLIAALEAANAPVALKQLAERAAMPASQAHLYLASFLQLGLVAQDAHTTRYELGPYALQLGLAAMRKLDVVDLARDAMERMHQHTHQGVFLSVWGNRGPTILVKIDGTRPIPMQLRAGYVLPLFGSVTGRVFLTFLPRNVTSTVLAGEGRAGGSDVEVKRIIAGIRRRGYAHSDNLRNDGFSTISAPVLDHEGLARAALSVIGPVGDFDISAGGVAVRMLVDAAREVSRLLGADAFVASGARSTRTA